MVEVGGLIIKIPQLRFLYQGQVLIQDFVEGHGLLCHRTLESQSWGLLTSMDGPHGTWIRN